MNEEFKLKNGRIVTIKRLNVEDYDRGNNYEFVHDWISRISKYLGRDFDSRNLELDKKLLYDSLKNKEANISIGALHKGKIIASSSLVLNPFNEKMSHIGTWGISVHPDFQNQGLGRKLLLLIEKIAKDKNLIKLEAEFLEGNEPAEILYVHKLGYVIEGRRKYKAKLKNG
ncbi:MAG: GNAT family N-acetyltransferase, partial [Candidatus Thorarchaeota archaeon]